MIYGSTFYEVSLDLLVTPSCFEDWSCEREAAAERDLDGDWAERESEKYDDSDSL